MKIDDIKVNQLIEIEVELDATFQYLRSRIEEVSSIDLGLAVPMYKGVIVPMRVGREIKVCLTYKEKTFAFFTTIIGRKREPIPLLIVNKPEELFPIQRRSYVRLPVSVPIKFRALPDGETVIRGTTLDISGGGALLLTKAGLERGQIIELELDLPNREPVFCKARVVRILSQAKTAKDKSKIAIEYQDISEGQRDRIFNYIFEKQREWIRKGLLE